MGELTKAQIGRCGELLVQYRLLTLGFESAPMTTDSGIDLVVYTPALSKAVTVQVKTNIRPRPAGGRGPPTLGWSLNKSNPAEVIAVVNLDDDKVWLLTRKEFEQRAQQDRPDEYHLYFYVDAEYQAEPGKRARDFERQLIENCAGEIFGNGRADRN